MKRAKRKPGRARRYSLAALMLLPTWAWGGSLDVIGVDLVASTGQIKLNQIVDGEKALLALKGREELFDTRSYKPMLFVPVDGPEQVAQVQCPEQKAFSVNADEPRISGTHTEFDVLHITFALCDKGPLSPAQTAATAQTARSRLMQLAAHAPPSPQLDALMQVETAKLAGSADLIRFTVSAFGHGAAFLPTAVAPVRNDTSLVVQLYIADYLHLPPDPKADTEVTAPLRKIVENPGAFVEALLSRAYAALRAPASRLTGVDSP